MALLYNMLRNIGHLTANMIICIYPWNIYKYLWYNGIDETIIPYVFGHLFICSNILFEFLYCATWLEHYPSRVCEMGGGVSVGDNKGAGAHTVMTHGTPTYLHTHIQAHVQNAIQHMQLIRVSVAGTIPGPWHMFSLSGFITTSS